MLLAGAAHAAEDSAGRKDPSLEEARQHAAKAKVHYDLGEFEKAAEEYILVYRLRPLPALLFNIAQSYRQAGQYDKAKQFYRAYLRENPDPQTTAAVKKALKEIDELLAKEKKTREAPPSGVRDAPPSEMAGRGQPAAPTAQPARPTTQTPPAVVTTIPPAQSPATQPVASPAVSQPSGSQQTAAPASALPAPTVTTTTAMRSEPSSTRRTWTYALAGASVAMLGGGALFAMKAKNIDNELTSGPHSTATADDLMSQSKSAHGLSAVLLGAGLAAGIGAGVLYFWPTSSGAAVAGKF